MRIITCLLLSVAITFSSMSQAGVMFAFTDVTSVLFRFQLKLANQGNPEAQYKVGEMYETGKGVKKDKAVSREWFEKASSKGHQKASYKILYIDISTNGLDDYSKSQLTNLRREAESNNADAQYYLGKMYAQGVGLPKSLNNALTWLNKATYNGVLEAETEAIEIDEELVRIRERDAKRRSTAAAATKKKKDDEEKAKQAKKDKERDLAAKRNEQRRKDARKLAEQRRKERERAKDTAMQKNKLENERAKQAQAEADKQQVEEKKTTKDSFESDPCKGKKARFLSTCKN